MSFKELQRNWTELGADDPFWAVLTVPGKRHDRWDRAEFFETGRREVAAVIARVETFRPLPARHRALDFGCGVGRLTQALGLYFEEVTGVDVSATMLHSANELNQSGSKCRYVLNQRSDLSQFVDAHYDFIYSSLTFQHMAPHFIRSYLAELARLLSPDGTLVFQLPARRRAKGLGWIRHFVDLTYQALVRPLLPGARMEMHGIPQDQVLELLAKLGLRTLDVVPDESAGPTWTSFRYTAIREVVR